MLTDNSVKDRDIPKIQEDVVHLARLSLSGRSQDIQLYVRRLARRYKESSPALSKALGELLVESPTRNSPLRRENATPIPVDMDSRLELIRSETIDSLDVAPVFRAEVSHALDQLVQERASQDKLLRAGLAPTRSALFTGAPGVGKTLAARWLAWKLKTPLLTLDLAAVMSSFLGRTGNNVRYVLDYAKSVNCILLLDEFDAVAKRRDDSTEIGELKRLVTVLLQEIDDWPAGGLLIAATNHPDLLDPAVWRRFEMKIEFALPNRDEARAALAQWAGAVSDDMLDALALLFEEHSFSEMERSVLLARRAAAMQGEPVEDHFTNIIRQFVRSQPGRARGKLAAKLVESGKFSQREAHDLTGVSRDTIRKAQHAAGKAAE
jgi:SpoVK/Ycf46/Vps4 family AAA+-type ATPase